MTQFFDPSRDYSVADTSSILSCTNPTIYALLKKGDLDSYKVGRSRKITGESIQRLRSGKTKGGAS